MKVCTACGVEYGDEVLFCQRDGTPLRKSGAASDLVGQVIADRYHITKKLGEGGMGQVYLAEHVKMGRHCAIKIMMPGTMADPEAISRFNREAANASRISHPNVCAIYDFGETPDGLIYLAMEFIEGKSLNGMLEESSSLPPARAAEIIVQCADALQAAHDLGIVHRDLKPDNIMVTSARGRDVVKVVDFGIAKAIGGDGGAQKVTKTGFVVGTPEYMSPEQLSGDPVDGRSDLYSLGLVFYRMLTGSTPFPADSQQETMIKRLTDDPLPLAQVRPDARFPAALQAVVDRVLARSPAGRYPHAADFARAVRELDRSITGMVDLEAGTQVVRPEDLKAALPATRVDAAARPSRPAETAAPAGTARMPAPAKKGLPLVPIAVGVVALAVGGGSYAMRDTLFGGDGPGMQVPTLSDTSTRTQPSGDTTGGSGVARPVRQATNPDTGARPAPMAGKPSGGTIENPPLRDSAGKPVGVLPDIGQLERELDVYYDDPEFVDQTDKRLAAKRIAEQVYRAANAPPTLQGKAAFVMYQALLKEQDLTAARYWLEQAMRLDPSSTEYRNQFDRVFKT
ncbi:MAG: protein kinase [Gemmatimonadota bacterium]|nr:protein kinase [Gemmatimonadota bacterium]MDH5284021.1 protein kinase [Gemmatimonadota bacterium]